MNSVTITGRLTADPELTKLERTQVCDMRIAENGSDRTPTFVDVAVFGAQAVACAEHLAKGSMVGVAGRLRHHEWQGPDGSKRSRHSIVGRRVDFLGPKPEESDREGPDPKLQAELDAALEAAIAGDLDEEGSEPVGAEQ